MRLNLVTSFGGYAPVIEKKGKYGYLFKKQA